MQAPRGQDRKVCTFFLPNSEIDSQCPKLSITMSKYGNNLREEEIKNKVAVDYFNDFDWTKRIGDVDYCIAVPTDDNELFEQESLLWAESKRGNKFDIYESFVQLILTIGKARTFDKHLPPAFLGAFDAEKFGFLPYYRIADIFYVNDFNWNVTKQSRYK